MPSEPTAKKPKISQLGQVRNPWDDARPLVEELFSGSDRAVALIAAAEVDNSIADAIASEWIYLKDDEKPQLFGGSGPLASLGAKVRIAHAMGLFGDVTRADLLKVAHIRNGFAHSSKLWTFTEEPIASECLGLKIPGAYRAASLTRVTGFGDGPRGMYLDACIFTTNAMLGRAANPSASFIAYANGIMKRTEEGELTIAQASASMKTMTTREKLP